MHKELAVALCTGDRRIDPTQHIASLIDQRRRDFIAHTLVYQRLANHSAPAIDFCLACFELRLHEQYQLGTWPTHREQCRQGTDDRDEREVGNDEIDGTADCLEREVADVEPLEHRDSLIVANPRV